MNIKLFTKYVDKEFCVIEKVFTIKNNIKEEFLLNPFLKYFILYCEGNPVGYLSFHECYEKVEIVNIEVKEEYRHKGYGGYLMSNLITYCEDKNVINITLEVNKFNTNAIQLYEHFGFNSVAVRKGYYDGIDGILMERKMMK